MNVPTVQQLLAGLPSLPAPTILDRAINYLAPRAGLQRLRARTALAMAGGFQGASHSRRNLREWLPSNHGPDSGSLGDLPTLRARSQDLVNNAPVATGAHHTIVTSTVGPGLQPWPRLDRELLGLSEDVADAWERQAKRIFTAWAESKACDVTDRADFGGLTQQVLGGAWTRGDIFAVRRWVERSGDLLALRLQLVEADRVSNPHWQGDTDRLRGGVELDANGAPVRYHVRNQHPGDSWTFGQGDTWDTLPARGPSGERLVLHVFRGERPGQTRGVPALAPVIETLKQLDRYSEAELTAAVLSAFFTVFVTTKTGEGDDGLAPVDPTAPQQSALADNEYRLAPGAVIDLAEGENITTANPGRPNEKFDPFFLAMLRQVGVALELPFELLVKHFTASYSASQAAINEAWRATVTRRGWLVRDFCQPAYEWVITEAILRGHLRAPGFFENPLLRRAWCGAVWTGMPKGSINPVHEATAAEIRLRAGITTLQQETAEMTGEDWEENHQQQAKERRARVAEGLIAAAPVAGAASGGAPGGEPPGRELPDPDEEEKRDAA